MLNVVCVLTASVCLKAPRMPRLWRTDTTTVPSMAGGGRTLAATVSDCGANLWWTVSWPRSCL